MIEIEKESVYGFEQAIRGMRNPMNSWDKSDSKKCDGEDCPFVMNNIPHDDERCDNGKLGFCVGDSDLTLMKNLVKAGFDHSKFMRMIVVYVDITAPMYWWKEFDTYKVGTVRNSCSTMHKIQAKDFTLDDFSHEHMDDDSLDCLYDIIRELNECRDIYNNGDDTPHFEIKAKCKCFWWQMIQLLPSSYNQKATVMLNYQVLRNMYHSRKNHKLDEWRDFCDWIENLPYSELITMEVSDG